MFDFLATGEVIIFSKPDENGDNDYSVLIIDRLKDNDVVGCSQTKTKTSQNRSYANPKDAEIELYRASTFFINNDWDIFYHGNRNEG